MVLRKSVNKKTNEELLKDLQSDVESEDQVITSEEDNILTFLRFYNIEAGNYPVIDKFLYLLYKEFSKEPVTVKRFTRAIGLYIPRKQKNYGHLYFINQKTVNLAQKAEEYIKNKPGIRKHKSIQWKQHFDNFIEKFEIKVAGAKNYIWVSSEFLYDFYDKWVYSISRKSQLSRHEFRQFCQIYFEHKIHEHRLWLKIDKSITKHLPGKRLPRSKKKARNSLTNEEKKEST
jgi:hypothetical protein